MGALRCVAVQFTHRSSPEALPCSVSRCLKTGFRCSPAVTVTVDTIANLLSFDSRQRARDNTGEKRSGEFLSSHTSARDM